MEDEWESWHVPDAPPPNDAKVKRAVTMKRNDSGMIVKDEEASWVGVPVKSEDLGTAESSNQLSKHGSGDDVGHAKEPRAFTRAKRVSNETNSFAKYVKQENDAEATAPMMTPQETLPRTKRENPVEESYGYNDVEADGSWTEQKVNNILGPNHWDKWKLRERLESTLLLWST